MNKKKMLDEVQDVFYKRIDLSKSITFEDDEIKRMLTEVLEDIWDEMESEKGIMKELIKNTEDILGDRKLTKKINKHIKKSFKKYY